MTSFIAGVAGAYLIVVGALYLFQRNLLYLPDNGVPSTAASGVPEMQPVTLATADGLRLLSWYRPAAPGRPTIAYFHGNGGHIGYRGFKVRPYLDSGFGILLVSYRGYGGNPCSPTEEGLYADGRAALAFLAGQGVPPARTVLYGESLGSGVAVQIAWESAGKASFAAIVLESPFTSVADVAASHYSFVPARWLVKDRFDSASKIAAIAAPLLVIHGEEDTVIPIRFGRELFAAAAEPKESHWLSGAGHNDIHEFGAARLAIEFIERRLAGPPAASSRQGG